MGEKVMKGKVISKVLSCFLVFAILMSTFSVAALASDSSNSTASNVNLNLNLNDKANSSVESMRIMPSGNSDLSDASNTSSPDIINESDEVPDPDLPVINDTDIDDTAKTLSSTSSCSYVWIKITDKYCKGYKVHVDGVYQFTEGGAGGVLDGYCCFKVTPGYHTFKLTLNGKEVSKGWNCQCGRVYNWMSMNDMIPHWCEDGGGNCDNPPTVNFDKSTYYEGDTVHITVHNPISGQVVDYEIIDCEGNFKEYKALPYGTSSIYYTLPTVSSCCYWKICFYWNEGQPPLGAGSYCTKCYSFYVCPKEPCKVWINVEDKYCKGYEVYVDGVYQFTEGESGTPDGYCRFWVTPGTHKFELRKDGCSVSKSWYCQCGTVYHWVSMNDMDPHWCECHQPEEVKFRGTVTGLGPYVIGAKEWYISVDKWISGSLPCDEIDVVIGIYPPMGSYDPDISEGDIVEVYGKVDPWGEGKNCEVGLNGESYYIKKIEEKWDVKFQGTVTGTENPYIEDFICEARIDKIISGADYIEEGWTVNIVLSAWESPCGTYEEVKKGDKIEVLGQRLPVYCWPPQISLCGRSLYYLKIEEKKHDLIIQDISWSPKDPKAGDKVTFAVTVKNQADRRINGGVYFYIDGEFEEGKGGETSGGYFSPGDTEVYHFDWTAETGTHTIKFVTNPDNMWTGENGEDEKSIKFDICSEDEIKFRGTYLYSCVPLMSFHGYVFSIDEVLAGKNLTGKAIIVYADTGPKYKSELPFFVPTLLNLTKGDKVVIYARAETKWEGLWDLKLPSDKYYIHKYGDHSAYINYLSAVDPFYGNYSEYILDPDCWRDLTNEKAKDMQSSILSNIGSEMVINAIRAVYPAVEGGLGYLSYLTLPATILLIAIDESKQEAYKGVGDAIALSNPKELKDSLYFLENSGESLKTVINEESSDTEIALRFRRYGIISAYKELCSFDQRFADNVRDQRIVKKVGLYSLAQPYIVALVNELRVDYALTTIEWNHLTGEDEEISLEKVSGCELKPHCFQWSLFYISYNSIFGYLYSKDDIDKYIITTSTWNQYINICQYHPYSPHLKTSYVLKHSGNEIPGEKGAEEGGVFFGNRNIAAGTYELDIISDEGSFGGYSLMINAEPYGGLSIRPMD